jgi:hypothetical protein
MLKLVENRNELLHSSTNRSESKRLAATSMGVSTSFPVC